MHSATSLLDDVNWFQVCAPFQAHDCINSNRCKVILVMSQDLGGQGGSCNCQQVLAQCCGVSCVVECPPLKCLYCSRTSTPESINNCHWMDLSIDQMLCLPEELSGQHSHRCGAITDLIILDL